jgi:hypothetical protein
LTAVISLFALPSLLAYAKSETAGYTIVCLAEARKQQSVKRQTEIANFPRQVEANFSALPALAAEFAGTTRQQRAPPLIPATN